MGDESFLKFIIDTTLVDNEEYNCTFEPIADNLFIRWIRKHTLILCGEIWNKSKLASSIFVGR